MKNYYEMLGISIDANEEEIKKAYKDLIKQCHPDAVLNLPNEKKPLLEKASIELNKIYEILKDPKKKKKYDNYLQKNLEKNKSKEQEEKQKDKQEQENFSNKKPVSHIHLFESIKKLKIGFYLATGATIIGIIVAKEFVFDNTKTNDLPDDTNINNSENNNTIALNRYYVVKLTDTLSEIAVSLDTTVSDLEMINDINADEFLVDGTTLKSRYTLNEEDLEFYETEQEYNPELSLEEYASINETDIETMLLLNKGNIEKLDNNYVFLSNKIVVPNFITDKQLKQQKSSNNKV